MATDVALVVENGLNGVIVSNRRQWESWGYLLARWWLLAVVVGVDGVRDVAG